VPPRYGRNSRSRQFRRPARDSRPSSRIQFDRRTVPQPASSVVLTGLGAPGSASERWELMCRDGWDWRQVTPGHVAVRIATLSADQALVVNDWLQRLKEPAFWWATSRELHSPGTSTDVADALSQAPWLAEVLPVLLEASTEGAPPPPPDHG
jgi:hypothetical protein